MQTNVVSSLNQWLKPPMGGGLLAQGDLSQEDWAQGDLERRDRRTDFSGTYKDSKHKSRDLDARYLRRVNSHAFELKLSQPARSIVAELNQYARQQAKVIRDLPPSAPAPLHGYTKKTVDTEPEPKLPPTVMESLGADGVAAQSFLSEFFLDAGEKMRQYQDKIGRLVDSMNGGKQMVDLDHYSAISNMDLNRQVFSMQAPNGSRMRLYMTDSETDKRLTVTYLNRETGSYDLDMLKKTGLLTDQEESSDLAPDEHRKDWIVDVTEVGRRITNGRLNQDVEYEEQITVRFL